MKKNRNIINPCYEEKSYHYQIYHCLKVKLSFQKKLFQKEKTKVVL